LATEGGASLYLPGLRSPLAGIVPPPGFLGWDVGRFHWSLGASLSVPAGGYEEGELSNLAFNRPIGDIFAAATWFDPETGLDISGAVGVELNGENPDTDYRSGNAVHLDLAITKNLTKEFSVGVMDITTRSRRTVAKATGSARSRGG
jgi:hypothetical protein